MFDPNVNPGSLDPLLFITSKLYGSEGLRGCPLAKSESGPEPRTSADPSRPSMGLIVVLRVLDLLQDEVLPVLDNLLWWLSLPNEVPHNDAVPTRNDPPIVERRDGRERKERQQGVLSNAPM